MNEVEWLLAMGSQGVTDWELQIAKNIHNFFQGENVKAVLDVGCGGGKWSQQACKIVGDSCLIVGLDVDKKHVAYAKASAEVAIADARFAPFKDSLFSHILVVAVLHHLEDAESFKRVLTELIRLGCRNAKMLCIENTIDNPLKNGLVRGWRRIQKSNLHLHGFSSNQLAALIQSCGVRIIKREHENLFTVYLCTLLGVYGAKLPVPVIKILRRFEAALIDLGFWRWCATLHLICEF